MAYPVMYLVKDTQGTVLFVSKNKKEAKIRGAFLNSQRNERIKKRNPLCLVKSQLLGWID